MSGFRRRTLASCTDRHLIPSNAVAIDLLFNTHICVRGLVNCITTGQWTPSNGMENPHFERMEPTTKPGFMYYGVVEHVTVWGRQTATRCSGGTTKRTHFSPDIWALLLIGQGKHCAFSAQPSACCAYQTHPVHVRSPELGSQ